MRIGAALSRMLFSCKTAAMAPSGARAESRAAAIVKRIAVVVVVVAVVVSVEDKSRRSSCSAASRAF